MESLSNTTRQELLETGRKLFENLQQSILENSNEYKAIKELAPRYTTEIDRPTMPGLSNKFIEALRNSGSPVGNYHLVTVDNVPSRNNPPYYNYVHVEGKAVLCLFNYGDCDVSNATAPRMF
jgi:hypothetical protein